MAEKQGEQWNLEQALQRKTVHAALKALPHIAKLGDSPLIHLRTVIQQSQRMGYPNSVAGKGLALRDLFLQAIETLKPHDASISPHEKRWRAYLIATERYVKGRSIHNLEELLTIARSTYNHEHAQMLEQIVTILKEWEITATLNEPFNETQVFVFSPLQLYQQRALLREPRADWGTARDPHGFCGRQEDLAQLTQWIVHGRCRLVSVSGFGGVGKTTLLEKLAKEVAPEFACIIWRSLLNAPKLSDTLHDIIHFLDGGPAKEISGGLDRQLDLLISLLRAKRCLIVLDNFESLFYDSQPVGHYLAGYTDYGLMLERVGTQIHQSCLVLTSREAPPELALCSSNNAAVRTYHIGGLQVDEVQVMLQEMALQGDIKSWQTLVRRYNGNPFALKIVATTIRDLFNGDIRFFLHQDATIFGGIRNLLEKQFSRLSLLEQDVLYWLAIEREAVSLEQVHEDLVGGRSCAEVLEALLSLQQRSLVEPNQGLFTLQNLVMEYTTIRLINEISAELERLQMRRLHSHALIKAQTKDFVRQSQTRTILQPIAERLQAQRNLAPLTLHLNQILTLIKSQVPVQLGYATGNLLNLFCYLNIDLSGYDFSALAIWQAYLVNVNLHSVNFAGADFRATVFAETFGIVAAVAFNAGGTLLAAGTASGDIRVWHMASGKTWFVCHGHRDWVLSVAFSHQTGLLASGSEDQTVQLWHGNSGQHIYTLVGHTGRVRSVTFSPDDQLLATGGDDATIRIWHVQTGRILHIICGHSAAIRWVAFSHDGYLLASGGDDQTIRLWNTTTGEHLKTFSGHTHNVNAVIFTPDAQLLISGSHDQSLRLWRTADGTAFKVYSHCANVGAISLHPNGYIVAGVDNDHIVTLWNIRNGQVTKTLYGHTDGVRAVAFSPDGRTLASGGEDQTVRLWQTDTGYCQKVFQGYIDWILAVDASPNGRFIAGSHDNMIRLWDITRERSTRLLLGHDARIMALTFSPDSQMLVSAGNDRTLRLWQVATGHCIRVFRGHRDRIRTLAMSPCGKVVASGGGDHEIRIWDMLTGQCLKHIQGHTDQVRALAFTPTGETLVSSSYDHTVKLWDVTTGECVQSFVGHTDWVRAVAVNTTGSWVASGSDDKTVKVWDINARCCIATLYGHTDRVTAVTFMSEDNLLISGSEDQTIKLWNLPTGECVTTLRGHTNHVTSLVFNATLALLVSSSDDGTIRLWDVKSGRCCRVLIPEKPYANMNVSNARGLTAIQKVSLKTLGAVDE